jgi:hypothetical protein
MVQPKRQAICAVCKEDFGVEWNDLAKHILKQKDSMHKRGRRWAHKVLTNAKKLNQKRDMPGRIPLTEQQKENKKEMKRVVSGMEEPVIAICPNCKNKHRVKLAIEHIRYEHAWMINGRYAVICADCRN